MAMTIEPLTVLDNGATIIASCTGTGDATGGRYVLAWTPKGEYVTWCLTNDGATVHGHYFRGNLAKAARDLYERAGRSFDRAAGLD